jgi:hypothetical protein
MGPTFRYGRRHFREWAHVRQRCRPVGAMRGPPRAARSSPRCARSATTLAESAPARRHHCHWRQVATGCNDRARDRHAKRDEVERSSPRLAPCAASCRDRLSATNGSPVFGSRRRPSLSAVYRRDLAPRRRGRFVVNSNRGSAQLRWFHKVIGHTHELCRPLRSWRKAQPQTRSERVSERVARRSRWSSTSSAMRFETRIRPWIRGGRRQRKMSRGITLDANRTTIATAHVSVSHSWHPSDPC